jgi:hypothetical protein
MEAPRDEADIVPIDIAGSVASVTVDAIDAVRAFLQDNPGCGAHDRPIVQERKPA